MKFRFNKIAAGTLASILCAAMLTGCGSTSTDDSSEEVSFAAIPQDTRTIFYALVSSAENSSLDYAAQYAYIEDIGDGRGYTAGIVGFTSGTGDLLEVVKKYAALKPGNNGLAAYIPALEAVNGTASHQGLGSAFEAAWRTAANDAEMVAAQDAVVDAMYLNPAYSFARHDGLSTLGAFVYYDALVVHGPGDDEDSFGGIRTAALQNARTPAQGGGEEAWLLAFLAARSTVMKKEAAHSDLSRIGAQRKFIAEENWTLTLPLHWIMYGDSYTLVALSDD